MPAEKKKIAYISGPISNIPDTYRSEFMEIEKALIERGFDIKNPVRFTDEIFKDYEYLCAREKVDFDIKNPTFYRACMDKCFEELPKCDFVVLTKSFGKVASSGADAEVSMARKLGIPVYELENLEKIGA